MKSSKVSVVIPCFNGEGYVGEAIKSALNQTYAHREVIVIDDGSTDGSLDVIRSFGDSIRWQSGPNRGGCAARNTGLKLASGELIQFLDADDVLLPHKLDRDVTSISIGQADVCVSRFFVDSSTNRKIAGPKSAPTRDALQWVLSNDICIVPMYRKEALDAVCGFRDGLVCCQEFDLHLRLAIHGARFVHSGDVGYVVQPRVGSVSHDPVRLYRVMASVLEASADRLSLAADEVQRIALASKATCAARWLLRAGDVNGGRAALESARRIHPTQGIETAYSAPARLIRMVFGAVKAERILWRLRQMRNPAERKLFQPTRFGPAAS